MAGIKNLNLNGESSPKISAEDLQSLQKASNNLLSEKLYSDVDIVPNSSGSYTLKQTADFADVYKNYDFNADVRGLDTSSLDDYITSKGFTKTSGTTAVREIDISSSSYKILNSVDDVADIVKKGSQAVGVIADVAFLGYDLYTDYSSDGEFNENSVSSAVISGIGGGLGAKGGAMLGAAIGSAVAPVVGTVIGGVIGGIIGGIAGSIAGDAVADAILQEDSIENKIMNSAADKVLDIFN